MTGQLQRLGLRRWRRRDQIRRLLLASVSPSSTDREIAQLLERSDIEETVTLARRHRVAALLYDRLRVIDHGVPTKLLAHLRRDRIESRARQLQAQATIATLHQTIAQPFLVVKGAVLAQQWYSDASLRSYVDVDVLVRRTDFRAVATRLIDAGLEHMLPSWDGLLDSGMAEVPLQHRSCTVDLHWHLVARQAPRHEIMLDEQVIFGRAIPIVIGSSRVATLDHEDTLLHLCIHSGLDGGRRLYQLVDVDRVVRSEVIDWNEFITRSHDARSHALCAAIIQRCHELIGTPVPAQVLERLLPYEGWGLANTFVNQLPRPDRRVFKGIASGMLVAAGRSTLTATMTNVALAASEAVHARKPPRLHRAQLRRALGQSQNGDDPRARERYLAWVDDHAAKVPLSGAR